MEVKSLVFLLLVVVAASLAQKKCCFPDQFEITGGTVKGSVDAGQDIVEEYEIKVAFDYTNRRFGARIYPLPVRRYVYSQVIVDYKNRVEYDITYGQPVATCIVNPLLSSNMAHCIPDDAVHLASGYFGDHKLTFDTFGYYISTTDLHGNATMSVSQGDCIPLSITVVGAEEASSVLYVSGFNNYTEGIQDPSKYFTVPRICSGSFSGKPVTKPFWKTFF